MSETTRFVFESRKCDVEHQTGLVLEKLLRDGKYFVKIRVWEIPIFHIGCVREFEVTKKGWKNVVIGQEITVLISIKDVS